MTDNSGKDYGGGDAGIEAVGLLADPVRRALYWVVANAPGEVGRDEAAAAAGVSRTLAAFHLDKLAAAGLLTIAYRRRSGRTGPGAGRPAKLYRLAEAEQAVSLPPRTYAEPARLLAEVVETAGLEPELARVARQAGAAAGAVVPADPESAGMARLLALLTARGYLPYLDQGVVRLRNCPFQTLAREFPPLICGMNLALLEGVLAACPAGTGRVARLEPRPGECCVALIPKNNDS